MKTLRSASGSTREGADGQAVVCPLLRGSSPTRGVAPKQHRGLRRAVSPAFRAVLFIPWRVQRRSQGAESQPAREASPRGATGSLPHPRPAPKRIKSGLTPTPTCQTWARWFSQATRLAISATPTALEWLAMSEGTRCCGQPRAASASVAWLLASTPRPRR
jgi:hypothetical protein